MASELAFACRSKSAPQFLKRMISDAIIDSGVLYLNVPAHLATIMSYINIGFVDFMDLSNMTDLTREAVTEAKGVFPFDAALDIACMYCKEFPASDNSSEFLCQNRPFLLALLLANKVSKMLIRSVLSKSKVRPSNDAVNVIYEWRRAQTERDEFKSLRRLLGVDSRMVFSEDCDNFFHYQLPQLGIRYANRITDVSFLNRYIITSVRVCYNISCIGCDPEELTATLIGANRCITYICNNVEYTAVVEKEYRAQYALSEELEVIAEDGYCPCRMKLTKRRMRNGPWICFEFFNVWKVRSERGVPVTPPWTLYLKLRSDHFTNDEYVERIQSIEFKNDCMTDTTLWNSRMYPTRKTNYTYDSGYILLQKMVRCLNMGEHPILYADRSEMIHSFAIAIPLKSCGRNSPFRLQDVCFQPLPSIPSLSSISSAPTSSSMDDSEYDESEYESSYEEVERIGDIVSVSSRLREAIHSQSMGRYEIAALETGGGGDCLFHSVAAGMAKLEEVAGEFVLSLKTRLSIREFSATSVRGLVGQYIRTMSAGDLIEFVNQKKFEESVNSAHDGWKDKWSPRAILEECRLYELFDFQTVHNIAEKDEESVKLDVTDMKSSRVTIDMEKSQLNSLRESFASTIEIMGNLHWGDYADIVFMSRVLHVNIVVLMGSFDYNNYIYCGGDELADEPLYSMFIYCRDGNHFQLVVFMDEHDQQFIFDRDTLPPWLKARTLADVLDKPSS